MMFQFRARIWSNNLQLPCVQPLTSSWSRHGHGGHCGHVVHGGRGDHGGHGDYGGHDG